MALKVGELYATVELDREPFKRHMTEAHGSFRDFGSNMLKQAALIGGGLLAAMAVKDVIGEIGKIGIAYQDALNTFQSVSGATAAQMDLVGKKAIELGNDLSLPNTSAADAALAMTELAKAGLSVDQSMTAAKATLQLAAAAGVDEATAATYTATALNAFGLAGDKAMMVADLLAAGANSSAAEIGDMALALQQSAAGAHALGMPIQELTTAIAEMANAGIKGSDAGTSIKTMLSALTPNTKAAATEMKALGVNSFDAQGALKPLPDIIAEYNRGLSKLTPQQRDQALYTIFGSDAQRAANIILGQSSEKFRDLEGQVTKAGAAQQVAEAKSRGLGGALRGLQSELETLALEIFNGVSPALEGAVRWLADVLPKAVDETKVKFGEFQRFVAPFAAEFRENLGKALHDSDDSFRSMRGAVSDAQDALRQFIRSDAFASLVAGLVVTLPAAFGLSAAGAAMMTDHIRIAATAIGGLARVVTDVAHGDFAAAWKDMSDTAKLEGENVQKATKDTDDFVRASAHLTSEDVVNQYDNMKARVENATRAEHANVLSETQRQSRDLSHEYRNSGETNQEQLAEGIRAGRGAPIAAEQESVRAAIDAARQEASGAATIGNTIAWGVANGIIAAGAAVDSAARAMIRNAKREMEATARTGSPSRLFAEEIGHPIGAGVAAGIDESSHFPALAASALIRQVLAASSGRPGMGAVGAVGAAQTGGDVTQHLNVYGAQMQPYEIAQELAWWGKTRGR